MNDVCAIVLAAGLSSRMGTQKLLLPFGDKTIVESVVENILNSGITQVLVVLGADHHEVAEILKPYLIKTVWNERFQEGMHTSVICGVESLPEGARATLIFLGDQPFISGNVVHKVLEAWQNSEKGIVIPLFEGKRGHPPLYDLKYRSELLNLDPSIGLRSVAQKFPEDIFEVETFSPEIVRDIDTKIDYINELNKIKEHGRNHSV